MRATTASAGTVSRSALWSLMWARAHHDDQIIQQDQPENVVPLPGGLLCGVLRHKLVQPGHRTQRTGEIMTDSAQAPGKPMQARLGVRKDQTPRGWRGHAIDEGLVGATHCLRCRASFWLRSATSPTEPARFPRAADGPPLPATDPPPLPGRARAFDMGALPSERPGLLRQRV